MLATPSSTARVFLTTGAHSCGSANTAGEQLTFLELPSIPVASAPLSGLDELHPRPLVSPVLSLGRQTPLLRQLLLNDRAWSRQLLEVTSWCIQGLPAHDGVIAVDPVSLPAAGVRIRLCGNAAAGPIRVLPARRESTAGRGIVTLREAGACAWLQHGDEVEFGACGRVRFVAVHTRTGVAAELAKRASFLWVQAPPVSGATTATSVPTALWSARLARWAAIPVFLKMKLLKEAIQLLQHAVEKEEEEELARMRTSASTAAPSESTVTRGSRRSLRQGKRSVVESEVCPSFIDSEEEGYVVESTPDHAAMARHSSEARQDACTATEDADLEAATPTTESQHRHNTTANSPPPLPDRAQTRSAPETLGIVSEPQVGFTTAATAALMRRPHALSCGRSPESARTSSVGFGRSPVGAPPAVPARTSANTARFSLATFSETMDDKLNEALLHLENGGSEVGDALVRQRFDPALLLGAMEDDLSGTRAASLEENMPTTSPSVQRGGSDDRADRDYQQRGRLSTAGRDKQIKSEHGRKSSSRRRGTAVEADEDGPSRRRRRTSSSAGESLSQTMRKEASGASVQPLTRADIHRLQSGAPVLEDSQVVFFDH